MELSERVLRYRARHEVSQADLAKEMGISNHTLRAIESGKRVTNLSRAKVEVWLDEHDNKV